MPEISLYDYSVEELCPINENTNKKTPISTWVVKNYTRVKLCYEVHVNKGWPLIK